MAICFVAFLPLMVVRHLVLVTIPTVLALPRAARAGEGVPCAPFAQEDPPEPTLRTDRHALDRLVRINQAVKNIPHAVLFLGDSLTEGWDPEVWGQNLGSSRGAECRHQWRPDRPPVMAVGERQSRWTSGKSGGSADRYERPQFRPIAGAHGRRHPRQPHSGAAARS